MTDGKFPVSLGVKLKHEVLTSFNEGITWSTS